MRDERKRGGCVFQMKMQSEEWRGFGLSGNKEGMRVWPPGNRET